MLQYKLYGWETQFLAPWFPMANGECTTAIPWLPCKPLDRMLWYDLSQRKWYKKLETCGLWRKRQTTILEIHGSTFSMFGAHSMPQKDRHLRPTQRPPLPFDPQKDARGAVPTGQPDSKWTASMGHTLLIPQNNGNKCVGVRFNHWKIVFGCIWNI